MCPAIISMFSVCLHTTRILLVCTKSLRLHHKTQEKVKHHQAANTHTSSSLYFENILGKLLRKSLRFKSKQSFKISERLKKVVPKFLDYKLKTAVPSGFKIRAQNS